MLTLYHSPNSRSSTLVTLIDEMGLNDWVDLQLVTIRRFDGSGGRDPVNPHPEGKVPVLVHDTEVITERGAIILHLCTLFPETGMSPTPGTPAWGRFISWLIWYQGVLEPVLVLNAAGIAHPWLTATFRSMAEATERLHHALTAGPWIMGDAFSAVDLLLQSPFSWYSDAVPDDPLICDWVTRCAARPAAGRTLSRDAALMQA